MSIIKALRSFLKSRALKKCSGKFAEGSRVEVLTKNNVRLAVNSGEKNFFHRKAPATFSVECAESGEFL